MDSINIVDITNAFIAFGSAIGLKELVLYLLRRKTEARKDDADADNKELDVVRKALDMQNGVMNTMDSRFKSISDEAKQKEAKIEELYRELRTEQKKCSELIFDKQGYELEVKNKEIEIKNLELKLQKSEYFRCERSDADCGFKRIPPRLLKPAAAIDKE